MSPPGRQSRRIRNLSPEPQDPLPTYRARQRQGSRLPDLFQRLARSGRLSLTRQPSPANRPESSSGLSDIAASPSARDPVSPTPTLDLLSTSGSSVAVAENVNAQAGPLEPQAGPSSAITGSSTPTHRHANLPNSAAARAEIIQDNFIPSLEIESDDDSSPRELPVATPAQVSISNSLSRFRSRANIALSASPTPPTLPQNVAAPETPQPSCSSTHMRPRRLLTSTPQNNPENHTEVPELEISSNELFESVNTGDATSSSSNDFLFGSSQPQPEPIYPNYNYDTPSLRTPSTHAPLEEQPPPQISISQPRSSSNSQYSRRIPFFGNIFESSPSSEHNLETTASVTSEESSVISIYHLFETTRPVTRNIFREPPSSSSPSSDTSSSSSSESSSNSTHSSFSHSSRSNASAVSNPNSYRESNHTESSDSTTSTMGLDYALMPRYDKPLVMRDVKLFIKQFKLWANQQHLTAPSMKATLALAFQNEDAKTWCLLNADKAQDAAITFDQYVALLLEQAPIQPSSSAEVFNIIAQSPSPGELASSYLLRIRLRIGDDWNDENQAGFITCIKENLPRPLVTYIASKENPPANFTDLLKVVREYEQQGRDQTRANHPVIKQEVGAAAVGTATQLNELNTVMHEIIREIALLHTKTDAKPPVASPTPAPVAVATAAAPPTQNRNSNPPRNQNSNKRNISCYFCNKLGHAWAECHSYKRSLNQNQGRGGRGRGYSRGNYSGFNSRGRGYGYYNQNAPPNPQQLQWQNAPPLQYHNTPAITYPPSNYGGQNFQQHQGNDQQRG